MAAKAMPKIKNVKELKKNANEIPKNGFKIANRPGPIKAPRWKVVVLRAIADEISSFATA
jgi:hypothetical protein